MADYVRLGVDLFGPIAITAMLAFLYGTLKDVVASEQRANLILGLLFGLMSILLMHAPFEPYDGIILDLRVIPIALAGAFLGLKGLCVCLVMAVAYRVGAGGTGALAGVAAILTTGIASYLWSEANKHREDFSLKRYFGLTAAVCTSLFSAVLLPVDLAKWFFGNAAPLLVLTYAICIPFLASLFDREVRQRNAKLMQVGLRHQGTSDRFLSEAELVREIIDRRASGDKGATAGLLAIRLHHTSWIVSQFGPKALGLVLGAMRVRLKVALTHGGLATLSDDGMIVVPVTLEEMSAAARIERFVGHAISSEHIRLGHAHDHVRPRISTKMTKIMNTEIGVPLEFDRPEDTARLYWAPAKAVGRDDAGMQPVFETPGTALRGELQATLFSKAEFLMQERTEEKRQRRVA